MRVGSLGDVDSVEVIARAKEYLANDPANKPYAYPWYDTYETNRDPAKLCDGDLLAPLLLNAAPDLSGYRTLKGWAGQLSDGLHTLCEEIPVSDHPLPADDPRHGHIGALYASLDADGRGGHISGTILAKVLHRKRPDVIPLYDHRVWSVYKDASRIATAHPEERTWVEFMTLLSRQMSEDLAQPEASDTVDSIRGLATAGDITALRAWDIVVWQAADG